VLPDASQVAAVDRLSAGEGVGQLLVSRVAELDHDVTGNRGEGGMPDQPGNELGLFRKPVRLPQRHQRRPGERRQHARHRIDRARLDKVRCHLARTPR
jgi:hypothetical protein